MELLMIVMLAGILLWLRALPAIIDHHVETTLLIKTAAFRLPDDSVIPLTFPGHEKTVISEYSSDNESQLFSEN